MNCFFEIIHPRDHIFENRKIEECYVGQGDLKRLVIGKGSEADIVVKKCPNSRIRNKQVQMIVDLESETVAVKQLTHSNVYDSRKRAIGKGKSIILTSGSKFWVSKGSYVVKIFFEED